MNMRAETFDMYLLNSILSNSGKCATQRAESAPGVREFFQIGLTNLMFFVFSIITAAMALATIAALVTFHTPIFNWLGYPFVVLLEFAQLPDAAAAAPGLFSGFLDQFLWPVDSSASRRRLYLDMPKQIKKNSTAPNISGSL